MFLGETERISELTFALEWVIRCCAGVWTGHAFSSMERWPVLGVKFSCGSPHPKVDSHTGQVNNALGCIGGIITTSPLTVCCMGKIDSSAVDMYMVNTRNCEMNFSSVGLLFSISLFCVLSFPIPISYVCFLFIWCFFFLVVHCFLGSSWSPLSSFFSHQKMLYCLHTDVVFISVSEPNTTVTREKYLWHLPMSYSSTGK